MTEKNSWFYHGYYFLYTHENMRNLKCTVRSQLNVYPCIIGHTHTMYLGFEIGVQTHRRTAVIPRMCINAKPATPARLVFYFTSSAYVFKVFACVLAWIGLYACMLCYIRASIHAVMHGKARDSNAFRASLRFVRLSATVV